MRTVIIGGGKGCRAILELATGTFLKELTLDVQCVMDPDEQARGMQFAREKNIPTTTNMAEALATPDTELVIELTGQDKVLSKIYKTIPSGVRIIEHTFAHIFWDLVNAQKKMNRQLIEITEMEQKIERERTFLQTLFETIPDMAVVLNRQKKAIRINKSFSEFTGFSPAEAMGKTCPELLANTELASECLKTKDTIDYVLKTGELYSMVWETPEPDETYWEVTRTPIKAADNKIIGVLGTWHRITDKVLLRRKIKSVESRFKAFIDSAHDWISIKDLEGKYVIVNPVCAEAFGKKPDDFIGKTAVEIIDTKVAKTIMRHDQEVIKSQKYHTYDEIFPIDGKDHLFHTVRFPLTDYKGSITGVCTISRDISAETELQNQLVQAEKLAAVGKLAAGVAHEINNPLTGILAYAEDLVDEMPIDSPHLDDMKVIIRETLRCRDIVRNLLDFARQDKLKLEHVNPVIIIEQALSLIEKLPQFRNVTIEKKIDDNTPKIKGDIQQLQQVVLNFMLNAAEAMKGKGTIKLSTSYHRSADKCIISVEDDGPGIPENLIDKIFEPFFSTKGTNGLGLAVSWGIIERHLGGVEVDMADNGGAIFRIVLPVVSD